jgi:hypothetical protein
VPVSPCSVIAVIVADPVRTCEGDRRSDTHNFVAPTG